MQHAQFMGQSVHFINVFPPAGDVFAICLLLFLQFQGQVVDLLVEVSVELLILQWNTHHRPSMTSVVVTMGKTAGRQITVIHRLMTARQRCNVNYEHMGMCKGRPRQSYSRPFFCYLFQIQNLPGQLQFVNVPLQDIDQMRLLFLLAQSDTLVWNHVSSVSKVNVSLQRSVGELWTWYWAAKEAMNRSNWRI